MKTPDAAIELSRVTKRFGDQVAVSDLTLEIAPGSKLGLIGIIGAGKSTTIKMMLGLLEPDGGRARIFGHDPLHDSLWCKQRVGYVPEVHLMPRWMKVDEVVWFCRGFYPTWNDDLCREQLRKLGLNGGKRVSQLSKGTLAKLSLVLALAHEPRVLLLDEPTSGLDPLVREEFLEGILQSVCDREQAVLFSSHILSDVERLADTIAILHEGRLLAIAPADELLQRTKRIRLVLPEIDTKASPPPGVIWQARDRREWQMTIRDFSPDALGAIRSECPAVRVDVIDLSIEEIFKDYVRGGVTLT